MATKAPAHTLRTYIIDAHETLGGVDLGNEHHRAVSTAVAKAIKLTPTQTNILLGIITDEVRRTLRSDTRNEVEKAFEKINESNAARRKSRDPKVRHGKPVLPNAARNRLLSKGFLARSGHWVAWLTATVQDHQDRASMLYGQIEGLSSERKQHEEAIQMINAAGVECLGDLGTVGEDFVKDVAA